MTAAKFDIGKERISLIPKDALLDIAKVLEFGAQKYGDHNWKKGIQWTRLIDAAMRHLIKFNDGQNLDEESDLNHLAHSCANLMFLLYYYNRSLGQDDRFTQDTDG